MKSGAKVHLIRVSETVVLADEEFSEGRAEFLANIVKVAKWLQTSPDQQNLRNLEEMNADVCGGVAQLPLNIDTVKNDRMNVHSTTIGNKFPFPNISCLVSFSSSLVSFHSFSSLPPFTNCQGHTFFRETLS